MPSRRRRGRFLKAVCPTFSIIRAPYPSGSAGSFRRTSRIEVRLPARSQSIVRAPNAVTDRPNLCGTPAELIRLMRSQATLWGTIDATGRWAVSFRQRNDLLFFRVDRGSCQLLRPGADPLRLDPGDFVLARTSCPITLASDVDLESLDSWALVASTRSRRMQVGDIGGEPALIRGGRFVFDAGSEHLLASLLPPLLHVPSGAAASDRVRALLGMIEAECHESGPVSEFVIVRLMELLLVGLLRDKTFEATSSSGLLAGLADPVIARALTALHADIARPWTTTVLARQCGSSRSGFSAHFKSVVGVAPMTYLHRWRMAAAKDELRNGRLTIGEIALLVGFQSGSAFSTAFSRVLGCSPSRFAARAVNAYSEAA